MWSHHLSTCVLWARDPVTGRAFTLCELAMLTAKHRDLESELSESSLRTDAGEGNVSWTPRRERERKRERTHKRPKRLWGRCAPGSSHPFRFFLPVKSPFQTHDVEMICIPSPFDVQQGQEMSAILPSFLSCLPSGCQLHSGVARQEFLVFRNTFNRWISNDQQSLSQSYTFSYHPVLQQMIHTEIEKQIIRAEFVLPYPGRSRVNYVSSSIIRCSYSLHFNSLTGVWDTRVGDSSWRPTASYDVPQEGHAGKRISNSFR